MKYPKKELTLCFIHLLITQSMVSLKSKTQMKNEKTRLAVKA